MVGTTLSGPPSQSTGSSFLISLVINHKPLALAAVAQWIECQPENRRVAGLIPIGAHAWVTGQVPSWGGVRGNHTMMFLSPSFSFPSRL